VVVVVAAAPEARGPAVAVVLLRAARVARVSRGVAQAPVRDRVAKASRGVAPGREPGKVPAGLVAAVRS